MTLPLAQPRPKGQGGLVRLGTNIVPLAVVALILVQLALQPSFATYQNLVNVTRMGSILALIAVGQMFVLMVRGFDMSVGSTMAMTSIAVASALSVMVGETSTWSAAVLALIVAVATGGVIGMINGLALTFLNVHSFIVTLGMSSIVAGAALWLTDGVPVYGIPRFVVAEIGRATWLGLPSFVWIAAVVIALLAMLLGMTRVGKYLKAAGRDIRAAELSGLSPRLYICLAYAICGICAGLAALLLTLQIGSGQGSIGSVYAFQSIAVCIIGGVSLMGGKGAVVQVVIAAAFIQLMSNGFELLRIPSTIQAMVLGCVVVAVAVLNLGKKE